MNVLIDLGSGKPESSSAKTYDSPGKGRKACSECNAYVGVRTKTCVCGSSFDKKRSIVRARPDIEEERQATNDLPKSSRPYTSVTLIPSGKCPIELDVNTLTEESIATWALKLRSHYLDDHVYLATEGILYMLRQFVSIFSPEYKEAKELILSLEE